MLGAHYLETDDCDFVADNVHKAIIKLHRLNRLQHNSSDDWAHNLLEATQRSLTKKTKTIFSLISRTLADTKINKRFGTI